MSYGGGRSEKSATTLYVNGFGPEIRARELAYEFEKFGRLVRCDIPAPKNPDARPFAFIEYEDRRDAADAYDQMHKKLIGRDVINVEFAKNTPSTNWRYEDGRGPPPRRREERRYDDRGPPPRRYDDRPRYEERRPPPRGRSVSPGRGSGRGSIGSVSGRSPQLERTNGREASPARERAATPDWEKQEKTPPPAFVEDAEQNRLDD